MNHRAAIDFFKTPAGKFALFCLIISVLMLLAARNTQAKQQEQREKSEALPKSAQVTVDPSSTDTYSQTRSFSPAMAARALAGHEAAAPAANQGEPSQKPESPSQTQPKLLPIKIFSNVKPQPAPPPSPRAPVNEDDFYAPYGRMLQCELTLTVDSSTIETPIVGIVSKDLYWNKKLIIPVNSEVHGTARTDRVRERIASTGPWTVVLAAGGEYPWGTELLLNGIALDMDLEINSGRWGISDGSAGLRGVILNNTNTLDEVKLFAATALRGVAEGFIPKTTNLLGQQVPAAGAATAAGQGATAVLDRYAQRIMEEIEQNGFYTRVPSGKQFYLYVRQDILLREARLGASLLASPTATTEAVMPPASRQPERLQDMVPVAAAIPVAPAYRQQRAAASTTYPGAARPAAPPARNASNNRNDQSLLLYPDNASALPLK